MRLLRRLLSVLLGGALGLGGGITAAHAEGLPLTAVPLSGVRVRLDGQPKELLGTWATLNVTVSGKPASTGFARGAINYDDDALYVAMQVDDDQLVRTAGAGAREDHATLHLAFPSGQKGYKTYVLELYPGSPGKLKGMVKLGAGKLAGAELVEAPDGDGFSFEAKIPWRSFAEASRLRVGMRAALRYTDATAVGKIRAVVGTSRAVAGGEMPALLTESERVLVNGFLASEGIDAAPSHVIYGNVSGDATQERVAIYGRFLTVVGGKFREGKEFVSSDLQIRNGRQVQRLQLADFDGDGRQEIVLVVRIGTNSEYREILEVVRAQSDDTLRLEFAREVGLKSATGEIHNEVKLERQAGKTAVVVAQGTVDGFEEDSYAEPRPSDMEAALLPWEETESKRYAWQGATFAMVGEKKQSGQAKKAKPGRASGGAVAGTDVATPPAPRPPNPDELLDQVYASYRKDRGVKAKKPRFDFVTDVAADSSTERVVVHEKDIVCFGKNFRDGASYVYTTIGVANPDDIIDMTASDLTGDGKAELLMRAVVHAKSSKEVGEKPVDRLVFVAYRVSESGISRVFAAETGRMIEGNLLLGGLRFLPASKGVDIEVRAGRAHGFTKATYPFPEDESAAGGYEPLPLPWGSLGQRLYRFDGNVFHP